ncbi:hypothetical protein F5Y16DRAFT_356510 [Xylariaceae sp. FL0255]|nr:hypothetical protein F5Y16DRAFT_356510 [Xylariaceae sp. FL0255]
MGLPLFVPRVESDIPAKSPAKTDPAHARSPIRRPERSSEQTRRALAADVPEQRRRLIQWREQRLRMLAAFQPDNNDILNNTTLPVSPAPPPHALRNSTSRDALRRDRLMNLSRLAAQPANEPSASENELLTLGYMLPPIREPSQPPTSSRPNSQLPRASRNERTTSPPPTNRAALADWTLRHRDTPSDEPAPSEWRSVFLGIDRRRPLDGLGDRDRSLSPEGDGVWDTLQSTLTPDPQPPSVGSSFASTNAGPTLGPLSSGTTSVNTSITTPATDPCEPGADNHSESDTELNLDPRRPAWSSMRRSYADVISGTPARSRGQSHADDVADSTDAGWLTGMHRIVSRLATREDIPDEWWAQAGLSRSMSWDDPTNDPSN